MNQEVELPGVIANIVRVLALVLVLSLAGLVVLGLFGGDPGVRGTLTHVVETVVGVFIGIAAARLVGPE